MCHLRPIYHLADGTCSIVVQCPYEYLINIDLVIPVLIKTCIFNTFCMHFLTPLRQNKVKVPPSPIAFNRVPPYGILDESRCSWRVGSQSGGEGGCVNTWGRRRPLMSTWIVSTASPGRRLGPRPWDWDSVPRTGAASTGLGQHPLLWSSVH